MHALNSYEPIIGRHLIAQLRQAAEPLAGRRLKMINSTAVGGGVAEILHREVPLLEGLGLHAEWRVMRGSDEFFRITKQFHCALHGQAVHGPSARDLETSWKPIAAMPASSKTKNSSWSTIAAAGADRMQGQGAVEPIDLALMKPSHGSASRDKPIVTQVSRFDRLKDPVGVVRAFRLARRHVDCRLVLIGGCADDDPEGMQVLRRQPVAGGRNAMRTAQIVPLGAQCADG